MKKIYNKPEMIVVTIETEGMMAASIGKNPSTSTNIQYKRNGSWEDVE